MYKLNGNFIVNDNELYFYRYSNTTFKIDIEDRDLFLDIVNSIIRGRNTTEIINVLNVSEKDLNYIYEFLISNNIIAPISFKEIDIHIAENLRQFVNVNLLKSLNDVNIYYYDGHSIRTTNNISIILSDIKDFKEVTFNNNRNLYPVLLGNQKLYIGPYISEDGGPCIKCYQEFLETESNYKIFNYYEYEHILSFIFKRFIENMNMDIPYISFDHQVEIKINELEINKTFIHRSVGCIGCEI